MTGDIYETALQRVDDSLLPKDRRSEAREAVRRYRSREDARGLREYMAEFAAESDEHFEREHGDFIREFEIAALTDISYAIAIARPAGGLAARRREKESAAGSRVVDSELVEAVEPPRVRVCPDNHAHGRTGSCYRNHSCRCEECRSSNSERRKKYLLAQGSTRTAQPLKRADWTPQPLADDDPRHGTPTGYQNWKCRCEACVTSYREYREMRKQNPTGTRSRVSEHGTRGRYSRGCRCALCTQAVAEDNRQRKKKKQS